MIEEGVWRMTTSTDGPRLVVLGGVHSNERTGVEVVTRLREALADGKHNKPSESFLVCQSTPRHARLYRWLQATKVLTDPAYILGGGEPVTTDEYAEVCGAVGICYESGQAQDVSRTTEVVSSVVDLLRDMGMTPGDPTGQPTEHQEVYEMTQTILLSNAGFAYADGAGQASFAPVVKGALLGYHGTKPFRLPLDGVLVFPKVREHWAVGKPVGFLARRVSVVPPV